MIEAGAQHKKAKMVGHVARFGTAVNAEVDGYVERQTERDRTPELPIPTAPPQDQVQPAQQPTAQTANSPPITRATAPKWHPHLVFAIPACLGGNGGARNTRRRRRKQQA